MSCKFEYVVMAHHFDTSALL